MDKNCRNCKYEHLSIRSDRCDPCHNWNKWEPKEPINTGVRLEDIQEDVLVPPKPIESSGETILDSGERRQFGENAAVRDMASKGRCDLLPWDVIAEIIPDDREDGSVSKFCDHMANAVHHKELEASIVVCLLAFIDIAYDSSLSTAMLECAYHYEAGARKYSDRNWEKGMPVDVFLDSAGRHFLKWQRGDEDEKHDRAVVWNLLGALWMINNKPEWIDKEVTNK